MYQIAFLSSLKRTVILLITAVVICFVSCDKDEESELPPGSEEYYDYEKLVLKPFFAIPRYGKAGGVYYGFVGLDPTQSSEGAKIDSVIYSLDNVRVAKVTESRLIGTKKIFPISMTLSESALGYAIHNLRVTLYCSGKEQRRKTEDGEFVVIPGDIISKVYPIQLLSTNYGVSLTSILIGDDGVIKNGDDLEIYVYSINTSELTWTSNIKLYWDGTLMKNKTFYNDASDYVGFIAGGPGDHELKLVKTDHFEETTNDPIPHEYKFNITVIK